MTTQLRSEINAVDQKHTEANTATKLQLQRLELAPSAAKWNKASMAVITGVIAIILGAMGAYFTTK